MDISKTYRPVWKIIPGSLKQISFDGRSLAGCNDSDDIFVSSEDVRTEPKWRHIVGKLKQVVVVGAALYGTNAADDIFFGRVDGRPWANLPGKLKQVHFDGSQLIGCNSADQIFLAWANLTNAPNWANIPGGLIHATVFSMKIFGVNAAGDLFYGINNTWLNVQAPVKFKQVSYDGTWLLAVDRGNKVWVADSDLESAPNFIAVEGAELTYADIFQGEIFGVDAYSKIHYTNLNGLSAGTVFQGSDTNNVVVVVKHLN